MSEASNSQPQRSLTGFGSVGGLRTKEGREGVEEWIEGEENRAHAVV